LFIVLLLETQNLKNVQNGFARTHSLNCAHENHHTMTTSVVPAWQQIIVDSASSVIGPECAVKMLARLEVLDGPCLKMALSKVLGILVVLGAVVGEWRALFAACGCVCLCG